MLSRKGQFEDGAETRLTAAAWRSAEIGQGAANPRGVKAGQGRVRSLDLDVRSGSRFVREGRGTGQAETLAAFAIGRPGRVSCLSICHGKLRVQAFVLLASRIAMRARNWGEGGMDRLRHCHCHLAVTR